MPQVLQQELQLHQKRLAECTPERVDALVAENAVLKRSCDELHVHKGQVEHYRGLWLGANKKNAELEVKGVISKMVLFSSTPGLVDLVWFWCFVWGITQKVCCCCCV